MAKRRRRSKSRARRARSSNKLTRAQRRARNRAAHAAKRRAKISRRSPRSKAKLTTRRSGKSKARRGRKAVRKTRKTRRAKSSKSRRTSRKGRRGTRRGTRRNPTVLTRRLPGGTIYLHEDRDESDAPGGMPYTVEAGDLRMGFSTLGKAKRFFEAHRTYSQYVNALRSLSHRNPAQFPSMFESALNPRRRSKTRRNAPLTKRERDALRSVLRKHHR